jgi:hypothetical protein
MIQDEPATFSVEVLAFRGPGDRAALAASISEAFGIPTDAAQSLVAAAPVAVKHGADADTTRRLAKVLLGLGAEICIRNEQTGQERVHSTERAATASDTAAEAGAAAEPAAASPDETAEADGPAMAAPPAEASAAEIGATVDAAAEAGAGEAGMVAQPRAAAENELPDTPPSERGSDPEGPGLPGDSVRPPSTNDPVVLARAAELAALSGVRSRPLDHCAACNKRIEKGAVCAACGYCNRDSKRYCRKCEREVRVASDGLLRKPWVLAVAALLLMVAASAFYFIGVFAAGVVAALAVGAALILYGRRMDVRCVPCRRTVEAYKLRPAEKKALGSARRRWMLTSVLFALLAVAMAAPVLAARPALEIDSFGVGWTSTVPWSHRNLERRIVTVQSDWGPLRLVVRRALNDSFAVRGYFLMHTMLPESSNPRLGDAAVERLLSRAVEGAVAGAKVVRMDRVDAPGGQPALEARFTVGGGSGRARLLFVDRNMVLTAFVAAGDGGADDDGGKAFLDSLQQRTQ